MLDWLMALLSTPGACTENEDGSITIAPEYDTGFIRMGTVCAPLVNDARACMGRPTVGEE